MIFRNHAALLLYLHLLLNVIKTKELIFDTRHTFSTSHCPISINGQSVELADSFRYDLR